MLPHQVGTWLTEARFQCYLDSCCGDHEQAVELYEWNIEVSAAFMEVLCWLEVAFRNVIDGQFPEGAGDGLVAIYDQTVWLANKDFIEDRGREQVNQAISRLREDGHDPTRDWIVSKLSFGFWCVLFTGRYEDLWRSHLRHAFPHGNGERKQVNGLVQSTLAFRNQVAHHEAIFTRKPFRRHEKILRLLGLIDPELERYVSEFSRVPQLLSVGAPSGYDGR